MYTRAIVTSLVLCALLARALVVLGGPSSRHGRLSGLWLIAGLSHLLAYALIVLRAFYNRAPNRKAHLVGWIASVVFWTLLFLIYL